MSRSRVNQSSQMRTRSINKRDTKRKILLEFTITFFLLQFSHLCILVQIDYYCFYDSYTTDFNDLVFILFVFDVYLRMIKMNVSFSTITQRSIAMRKTMKEVRKTIVFRQMNDVLNMRNDSSMILIHDLSLNSFVLMYRERNAD